LIDFCRLIKKSQGANETFNGDSLFSEQSYAIAKLFSRGFSDLAGSNCGGHRPFVMSHHKMTAERGFERGFACREKP